MTYSHEVTHIVPCRQGLRLSLSGVPSQHTGLALRRGTDTTTLQLPLKPASSAPRCAAASSCLRPRRCLSPRCSRAGTRQASAPRRPSVALVRERSADVRPPVGHSMQMDELDAGTTAGWRRTLRALKGRPMHPQRLQRRHWVNCSASRPTAQRLQEKTADIFPLYMSRGSQKRRASGRPAGPTDGDDREGMASLMLTHTVRDAAGLCM